MNLDAWTSVQMNAKKSHNFQNTWKYRDRMLFWWHIKMQDYGMEVRVCLSEFHVTLFWRLATNPD